MGQLAGQHGGVTDILSDHGLAQTIAAYQDEVAASGTKSSVRARSTTSRSILSGQDHSKSAIDIAAAGRDGRASFRALLMPLISVAPLLPTRLIAAGGTAIPLPPDHSGNTKRTARDIVWRSKNVAAEPVRHACSLAGLDSHGHFVAR